MKTITAKTLEEAIIKASSELGCSVLDLQYEVIQAPSHGFLGFGRKDAIIEVSLKEKSPPPPSPAPKPAPKPALLDTKIAEIKKELCTLLAYLPYQIDQIKVELYDPQTLLVELNGPDSALIIGEKGYRFNALSYLLFNWIHQKYGYNVRLEVARFLRDQEEMMETYLQGVIMQVHEVGKAQTKPLDGMLIHIALKRLRETFPHKHITCQSNDNNERFIVINDFYK